MLDEYYLYIRMIVDSSYMQQFTMTAKLVWCDTEMLTDRLIFWSGDHLLAIT